MRYLKSTFFICLFPAVIFSQKIIDGAVEEFIPGPQICLSEEQRELIKKRNQESIRNLGLNTTQDERSFTLLGWPLRQANGFNDPDYYLITNFVDQNTGAGILDYNCGSRTYNGHHGTDIVVWPFMWHKQKINQVEVIAGQDGTIIGKVDGHYDLNCECANFNWNAVYLMHTDGSVGWYGHLKSGSLTQKPVGATVVKGEYLGSVGSSGCSTAPHLHFELYQDAAQTILIDPFSGPCNSLNATSWWEQQKPYVDPQLLKTMIHDCSSLSQPDGCPSNTYQMCEQYSLTAGAQALFSIHFRQQQAGQVTNLLIRRPDGSVFDNWNLNNGTSYTYGSWWYWARTIPASGPFGTWTYEVTDEGITHVKPFQVGIPNSKNVGVGDSNPTAKLNVNQGDIYVESLGSGVIMRSPDGKCWKLTVGNSGTITATTVMCPD